MTDYEQWLQSSTRSYSVTMSQILSCLQIYIPRIPGMPAMEYDDPRDYNIEAEVTLLCLLAFIHCLALRESTLQVRVDCLMCRL